MLTRDEVHDWLCETNTQRLRQLWQQADETRKRYVGDEVHLRGLIEISNHCVRRCAYCGIRQPNHGVTRYRMSEDEILASASMAAEFGYGTVVLQAGEDFAVPVEEIAHILRRIKKETGRAITLSLGERDDQTYRSWREAGGDRYLLRIETSNPELFARIHPHLGDTAVNRMERLRQLRKIGFEIGSGVMIGLPGQTWESLTDDLLLFREVDMDMLGTGPFIPHPDTPLGAAMLALRGELQGAKAEAALEEFPAADPQDQVPGDELTALKVLALTRLLRPDANIPSTTALATLNLKGGKELGLQRGANVIMPNLTPMKYRSLYEIYPAKACVSAPERETHDGIVDMLKGLGRKPGKGPGFRPGSSGLFHMK